ncbi:hypothetical protein F5879DRAFT_946349 [Lentinula edodes]|uniref:uncharacterized protein n=1 Tax=Lentinula edodes TaxID=5353 RepID=UPI001E8E5C90|nr:uncharacterized protein C8R40DRAFT_1124000 [Lentinula edodes]KAH7871063.1 hypothetical protein C8R40DRAFT_1124000 [Lentinula edodes]KAJ3906396.1 hypothetical protein F5879DRAFT_946349 [Lentinula edodes]
MVLPTQPSFMESVSIAETVPMELWERIIYYANAREEAFLGPPRDIVNICLVCRFLNSAINFGDNPSLYARLFRFKFDYRAPLRRFGRDWLTARSMALEFKKRIILLKQVRRKECSTQDLWTCYLMILENDGRNERQLIEWAHLYGYLKHETCVRYEATLDSTINWFKDTEATSLLLWLWWMSFSRDDVRIENSHVRDSLIYHLLHNLIVASFRYPNVYGPESHFKIPPAGCTWSSTPPTPVARVNHFSKEFDLATPLLSVASFLIWTLRLETIRENIDFDLGAISSLPLDRDDAMARRIQGPTQTDVLRFHQNQIRAPTHCSLVLCTFFEEEILTQECEQSAERLLLSSDSRRYDQDWYRSWTCFDSLSITPSNHNAYVPGALLGDWEGFFVQTSLEDHIALVDDPNHMPLDPISLYRHPLYFTLKEHHCFHPEVPIGPGTDCIGGEDVLNAWLPQGLKIQQYENEVEVFDPVAQRNVRYQTFLPGGLEGTKERLQSEKVPGTSRKLGNGYNYTNSFSLSKNESLNDILVTGKTSEENGAAWGHYLFVGRVRLWDGFIVLLRTPRDPTRSNLGRWLFRGYLHDGNFVGHWRETSTSPNLTGYRGEFVAHNRDGRNCM